MRIIASVSLLLFQATTPLPVSSEGTIGNVKDDAFKRDGGEERRLEVVDLPPYKRVIDVPDDHPVTVDGSLTCIPDDSYYPPRDRFTIYGYPERWDYYQLNLRANHCYTVTVHKIDCNMTEAFGVYKGIATMGNSPDSNVPIIDAAEIARETSKQGAWRFRTGSKYCGDSAYDARQRLPPVVEDGPFTLAVWYDATDCTDQAVDLSGCGERKSPPCDGSFEYEIEIESEMCPAGKVTYEGVIDAKHDGTITAINASIPCTTPTSEDIQSIPEFWKLWQVNVLAGYCYTFVLNRVSCGMSASMSLYKGIAKGATSGASSSDPDALVGATLVNWVNLSSPFTSTQPPKYCPGRERLVKFEEPSFDGGAITLAIHYSENSFFPCVDSMYEYEIEVHSRQCVGLLDACSSNDQCTTELCTGRPGKPTKCRFCARKKEICSADEECCQSQAFPGRYCNNGQCNKRPFPILLAISERGAYDWVDTTTGERRVMVKDEQGFDKSVLANSAIEYDSATGILYGMSNTGRLYKIDPFTASEIEELSPSGCADGCTLTGMEFVDGKLYGTEQVKDDNYQFIDPVLVTVNTTTGEYNTIGRIDGLGDDIREVGGLAFDGNTMYGVATYNRPNQRFTNDLITIDLDTARVTWSVPIVDSESGEQLSFDRWSPLTVDSLEFGAEGTLYGGVYTIDKATGDATRFQQEDPRRGKITGLTLAY